MHACIHTATAATATATATATTIMYIYLPTHYLPTYLSVNQSINQFMSYSTACHLSTPLNILLINHSMPFVPFWELG